jgi:predicted transcriptional regulator
MTRAFGDCARFASFARDYVIEPFRSEINLQIDYARELNPQQLAAVTAPLALKAAKEQLFAMTDKQAVMDALQRLPEKASLDEITEELHLMAAVRRGRADIAAGRTKSHAEAEQLLDSWGSVIGAASL